MRDPVAPVRVHGRGPDGVEVGLHGEIRAQDAPLIGSAPTRLVDDAPPHIRITRAHRRGSGDSIS
ncbi:hypothetical protein SSAG_00030 [Streptomyces sp. Mg1]|nr:hypothetical protein SSAG_00030 [Streptomyces sp. Mg1]